MPELTLHWSSDVDSVVTDAIGALVESTIEQNVFEGGREKVTASFSDPDSDYAYTVEISRGILYRPPITGDLPSPIPPDVQNGLRPDEPIRTEYARWPETRDRLRSPTYRPVIPMGGHGTLIGGEAVMNMAFSDHPTIAPERTTLPPDPRSEWEEWLGSQGRR